MFKSVSKAMLSMVLDKKARDTMDSTQKKATAKSATQQKAVSKVKSGAKKAAGAAGSLDSAGAKLEAAGDQLTEREKLIAQATMIHKKQSHLMDNVDPKLKEKMRRLAMEQLLRDTLSKRDPN